MSTILASGRIGGRPGRAVHAALSGVWLGLLSDAQLRSLDERYYDRDPTYTTAAWNERGLAPWERDEIERGFAGRSRVVVPACGGGREVLALLAAGFDVIGYESHPALSRYAQAFLAERGHPGRALPMARDRFPDCGRCDGVLVGWGAYSLIAPRHQRVAFLRAANAATAPGGRVMLSFFARPAHGRELRLTARLAGRLRRVRGASPVELGDTLAPNRVHVFTREEIDGELRDAGLALDSYRIVAAAAAAVSYACAIGRTP